MTLRERVRGACPWCLALSCWSAAVISLLLPGVSEASVVDVGDVRFKLSDVLVILGVAFAWGDMRQWRKGTDARIERIEEKLGGQ